MGSAGTIVDDYLRAVERRDVTVGRLRSDDSKAMSIW